LADDSSIATSSRSAAANVLSRREHQIGARCRPDIRAPARCGNATATVAFRQIQVGIARLPRNRAHAAARPEGKTQIFPIAPRNNVIERQKTRPARDQDQETGRPCPVGRPGIGIDEDLNDQRHDQQRDGGEARGQADRQKDRALAAALYALHCTDDSPLFVATWYSLAIAGVTVLGWAVGSRLLRW